VGPHSKAHKRSGEALRYLDMKDEIKGKAHEMKGKLTGDKPEEWKGKAEQEADKLRRTARDVRDDMKDEADKDERPDDVREEKAW
jgi:uncharacterized protein YjbJ (UPF0337 family)